ncbi:hypothetical protein Tco_1139554, partial [Tanacetum coccineum]
DNDHVNSSPTMFTPWNSVVNKEDNLRGVNDGLKPKDAVPFKRDVSNVPVWVKLLGPYELHFVRLVMSAFATKLGNTFDVNSIPRHAMCIQLWGVGILQKDDDDEISNLVDLHMGMLGGG